MLGCICSAWVLILFVLVYCNIARSLLSAVFICVSIWGSPATVNFCPNRVFLNRNTFGGLLFPLFLVHTRWFCLKVLLSLFDIKCRVFSTVRYCRMILDLYKCCDFSCLCLVLVTLWEFYKDVLSSMSSVGTGIFQLKISWTIISEFSF